MYLGTPVLRRRIRVLANRTTFYFSKFYKDSLSRNLNTFTRESCRFRFVSTRIGNAQMQLSTGVLEKNLRSGRANARETRFRFVYLGTPVLRRRIRVPMNRTVPTGHL